ncbi:MAG: transporter [Sphingomonas bacterium]|nr:MFS transporter [Sphingomonas bacterium]MDB5688676.1 transporter [Sphingomonas bacterium]
MTTAPTSRPIYRFYVLGLLTLVYAFNFIDRQIVTILAPYIKADLHLSDAQLGMLFGTAFALFYALFGLPLAKLADGWHRVGTLGIGLALWSTLTAASAGAASFGQLALARIGVGIGEASAAPAAFSLIQDYFGRRRRATALAIYSSGIYLGAGASVMAGGSIVAAWDATFANDTAPLGLAGWQAAYLAAGLPGLALTLLVLFTIREPVRGAIEGRPQPPQSSPFRAAAAELETLFPPFSLWALRHLGADAATIRRNLFLLATCIAGAVLLVAITDSLLAPAKRAVITHIFGVGLTTNMAQWIAIAVGVYATGSWMQAVRLRDPVAAKLTLGTPSFVAAAVAGGLISLSSYGLAAFLFLFGTIHHGLTASDGVTLGAIAAVAGGLGTLLGGILSDAARQFHPAGRLHVASAAALLSALASVWQYTTPSLYGFYGANFVGTFFLTMWLAPVAATCQDQVLPRMRGTATALQFLATNLIGLGLGPYLVGLISDITGDLRTAMLSVLLLTPIVLLLLQYAARHLQTAEATLADRALAAGDPPSC